MTLQTITTHSAPIYADINPTVGAATVAAVTSILTTVILRYFVDIEVAKRTAESDYHYEQRKEPRKLVGRYDGPLVEAAADLHHRLMNLYINVDQHWHKSRTSNYAESGYYLRTTVYRFLALMRLAARVEAEALYLDPRIASKTERDFARFVKALQWVLSDVRLYAGLGYDADTGTDHFLRDELRSISAVDPPEGSRFDLAYFNSSVGTNGGFLALFEFFDDISPDTHSLRWDRLVCFHLVPLAFMNAVGYDELHKTGSGELDRVAKQIRTRSIATNFVSWLTAIKLDRQTEIKAVMAAVSRVAT